MGNGRLRLQRAGRGGSAAALILRCDTRYRYRRHAAAVEFRPTNVEVLARGTCLSADPETYWNPPGRIALQTKSDVFRLLVLHLYGGIWVDTDTVLLKDARAVVECAFCRFVVGVFVWGPSFCTHTNLEQAGFQSKLRKCRACTEAGVRYLFGLKQTKSPGVPAPELWFETLSRWRV